MFRAHVLIIRRSKLHYTASGIITPIDVMSLIHVKTRFIVVRYNITVKFFNSVFNQLDAQNLFHNKFYSMPLHVSSTCAHHQEVKIALHSLWNHHTYRCDKIKLIAKQILCIKLVNTEINILRCTVSKTSTKKKTLQMLMSLTYIVIWSYGYCGCILCSVLLCVWIVHCVEFHSTQCTI